MTTTYYSNNVETWELALELTFVLGGVTLTVLYHLLWITVFLRKVQYTTLGVNIIIRFRWADKLFEKTEVIAIQCLRNNNMMLVVNASVIVTVLAFLMPQLLRGDVIVIKKLDFTQSAENAVVSQIKVLVIFIILLLSFYSFIQSMKLSVDLGYILNIASGDETLSYVHLDDEVCRLIRDQTVFYWLGMRFFYLSFPVILYLIGPSWYLGSTILLLSIFFFQIDFQIDGFSLLFIYQGFQNERKIRHMTVNPHVTFFRGLHLHHTTINDSDHDRHHRHENGDGDVDDGISFRRRSTRVDHRSLNVIGKSVVSSSSPSLSFYNDDDHHRDQRNRNDNNNNNDNNNEVILYSDRKISASNAKHIKQKISDCNIIHNV